MRRCGRVSCFVLVGLLAAVMAAGGAYAAAGGHQGKGHAWAKGQSKHAATTPQLSQPTAVKPAHPVQKPRQGEKAAPEAASHGVETRHNHLTICHLTGSGRYIVISPNVNGAMNGHLKHHDDFVYVDGCEQPARAPAPDPAPKPSPKPPAEGAIVGESPVSSGSARELPFTGIPAGLIVLGGALLAATGLTLRFRTRS
jgi:pyruvate/2-oxoglutarate dehydrogenase complex dihydrolipoamide acyltransferase (E2) component